MHFSVLEVVGSGDLIEATQEFCGGEEGLHTSVLSFPYVPQLLNHSAFSCLENLTFQRQRLTAWSSSAAICPFTCLASAASRASLSQLVDSIAIKLLFLAGFELLCSPAQPNGSGLHSFPSRRKKKHAQKAEAGSFAESPSATVLKLARSDMVTPQCCL